MMRKTQLSSEKEENFKRRDSPHDNCCDRESTEYYRNIPQVKLLWQEVQEDFPVGATLEFKPKGRGGMNLIKTRPSRKRQKEQHRTDLEARNDGT